MATTIIDTLRMALRIESTALDSEIEDNLSACLADLARVGITAISTADPVIIRLAVLYEKEAFDFMRDGERFGRAYAFMRDGVSLSGDYNGEEV